MEPFRRLNQVRISAVFLTKIVPVYRGLAALHRDIRNRKDLGDRIPIPGRNEQPLNVPGLRTPVNFFIAELAQSFLQVSVSAS